MFFILLIVGAAAALPNPEAIDQNSIEPNLESARSLRSDCAGGIFSPSCLKIEAISLLEKLSTKDELNLLPGVSVVKESKDNESSAEEFASELAKIKASKPDERLDKYLVYRLGKYLDSHSVRLKLMDDGASEEARALIGEARKGGGFGGGKKGGMGGLMAAALMMKGTLLFNLI